MDRRHFLSTSAKLAALAGMEPHRILHHLYPDPKRLSWLSQKSAGKEGAWPLKEIEGEVPKSIEGTLLRIAPGQSHNHGVVLKHIFDGDAFLMGFAFREGRVDFRARFIATPERLEELEAGRMLYSEVGTPASEKDNPWPFPIATKIKNQPSIHVIHWDGHLLGLSDSGPPTAITPSDFSYEERWGFHQNWNPLQAFTAHPRFDPATKEGFAFGWLYSPDFSAKLIVWKMELDGKLTELASLPKKNPWLVHEMFITPNYIAFIFASVRVDLDIVFSGPGCMTDTFKYLPDEPARVVIFSRDGKTRYPTVQLPPSMVFHHGNAHEKDGHLILDTFFAPNGSILKLLSAWSEDKLPLAQMPRLTRVEIEPKSGKLIGTRSFTDSPQEFPHFDQRYTGVETQFLYALSDYIENDPLASRTLVKRDFRNNREQAVKASKQQVYGEPIFVAASADAPEAHGWILLLGYDAIRDRTFLEIRDAQSLDFAARIWTPDHYPLGFHGSFTPSVFAIS